MHGTGEVVIEDTRRVYQTPNKVDDALTTPLFFCLSHHTLASLFWFHYILGMGMDGIFSFFHWEQNIHDQA